MFSAMLIAADLDVCEGLGQIELVCSVNLLRLCRDGSI